MFRYKGMIIPVMPKKAKKTTASDKKAVTNTPAKPKAAKTAAKPKVTAKPKSAKPTARGKRYTPAEKAKVLAYVNEVNTAKGRGGAAAAHRKFGISQITIGQWVKKSGSAAPAKKKAAAGRKVSAKGGRKATASAGGAGFAAKLRRLADVHESISRKKAELASLEKEYAKLKKGL